MLVIISAEKDVENEHDILNALFEEGLNYYHLRKPAKSLEEHHDYLKKIKPDYHNRIVVHYFHELRYDFGLKGVHLQEQVRIDFGDNLSNYINQVHSEKFSVSSSFHEPKVLEKCEENFDYHLLSPVFSSISKSGYEGKGFDVNAIDKLIVGMGGINEKTIDATVKLGFKGVGVLGGIWNSNDPIKAFKAIKDASQMAGILNEN